MHRMGYSGAGVARDAARHGATRRTIPVFACARVIAEYDFRDGRTANTQNEGADNVNQHNHGTGTWSTLGGYGPRALIGPRLRLGVSCWPRRGHHPGGPCRGGQTTSPALEWGDTLGVEVASAKASGTGPSTISTVIPSPIWTGIRRRSRSPSDAGGRQGDVRRERRGQPGPRPSTIGSPADADSVITVGAVDSLGVIQTFSSRGPTRRRADQARSLRARPQYLLAQAWTDGYGPANGTSLATPSSAGWPRCSRRPTRTGRARPSGRRSWDGHPRRHAGQRLRVRDRARRRRHDPQRRRPSPARTTLPFALLVPRRRRRRELRSRPPCAGKRPIRRAPGTRPAYRVITSTKLHLRASDTFTAARTPRSMSRWRSPPGSTVWWKVERSVNQGYIPPQHERACVHRELDRGRSAGDRPEAPTYALRRAAQPDAYAGRDSVSRAGGRAPHAGRSSTSPVGSCGASI